MVRMYELDENEEVVWSTNVHILPPNVHRQTAIVFNVPPYRDQNITREVKVYMQLLRPNDGAVSESREFFYRPDPYSACRKRARLNNSGDSVPSTSSLSTPKSGTGRIRILQDIPVQKMSPWGGVPSATPAASTTSAPNTVIISGNSQNNVSAIQPGNSQHCVSLQQFVIHGSPGNMGQMTQGSECITSTSTAGASTPQSNMLQVAPATQFDNLTTQSESQDLLLSRTVDPLLSSSGFNVWPTSAATNSTYNPFPQVVQMNQTSQPSTPATIAYAGVSSELSPSCQTSQSYTTSSTDSFVQVNILGGNTVENYVVVSETEQSYENNATVFNANPTNSMAASDFDTQPVLNHSISLNDEGLDFNLPYLPVDSSDFDDQSFLNYFTDLEDLRKENLEVLSDSGNGQNKASMSRRSKLNAPTRTARYTIADTLQAKALLKDICDMYKANPNKNKADIRQKLDKLFELRLSNGNTFLHMTLQRNLPSFEAVVKIVDAMNMNHLLNLPNDLHQTILHMACAAERPSIVTLLIEKGCDPMARDAEGNTAIHLAAMYQTCLEPLLEAMNKNNVKFDLDAYNLEKQTALHVAVVYSQTFSVVQLLALNASASKADFAGRTPLHLAATFSRVDIVKTILQYKKSEVDVVDSRGWTSLQIACNVEVTDDSLAVIRLLLINGANPTTHKVGTTSALALGSHQPQIRALFEEFNFNATLPDVESDDEFESADEGDSEEDITSQLDNVKLS